MAKFEKTFNGNFEDFVHYIERSVVSGSMSASIEDKSDVFLNDVKIAVRVFERYSAIGSNRVSLNVTIVSKEETITVIAITSGGSQAMFLKVNTFGESSFLTNFERSVNEYIRSL